MPPARRTPKNQRAKPRGRKRQPEQTDGPIYLDNFDLLAHANAKIPALQSLPRERQGRSASPRRSARHADSNVDRKQRTRAADRTREPPPLPRPTVRSGFMGVNEKNRKDGPDAREHGLEDVTTSWWRRIIWDGLTDRPIIDQCGRVIAVLRRRVDNNIAHDAATRLDNARSALNPQKAGRRGRILCCNCRGPVLTMGMRYVVLFDVFSSSYSHVAVTKDSSVAGIITTLLAVACFVHIAEAGSATFKEYNPNVWQLYTTIAEVLMNNVGLAWNFAGSVFAAATFNLGPRTVTYPHYDGRNLLWGWCVVTALGWFDYKRGGHLILWDLRLVVEFPPGSSILIPSGLIRHSNVKIGREEKRFSLPNSPVLTDASAEAEIRGDRAAEEARWEAANCRSQEGIDSYRRWP
ncbi:hypothetical protein C8F04DRAFT_1261767 [Mycena alexandri]|uniref:Uncharacterized protein n=1 Tax=Mycena alexandri TaxID=1745969 RepID=A0AAD6SSM7_9AGAR|nr:hypothetical protein C8F04DRAFT_1261767 [Mycena alexandri]